MVNGVEGISLQEQPTWREEDMAVVGPCLRLAQVRLLQPVLCPGEL